MGQAVEIAAWFVAWSALGIAGTLLLSTLGCRTMKGSRWIGVSAGAIGWFVLSTLGVCTYFALENAELSKSGKANVGFVIVLIFVWFALSLVGTAVGAVVALLTSIVGPVKARL